MALTALNPALASLDPDALPDDGTDPGDEEAHAVEVRQLQVPMDLHTSRLDKALAQQLLQVAAGKFGHQLGQAVQKPAAKVKLGDQLTVAMRPTAQSQAFKPEAMALNVVFEDEHLLVVNKPAGLVVHPAPGNWSGTLLNGLLAHHAGAVQVPRAGIVHRLDKDTSGLMVVAKTRAVMDALVALIAQRDVSRRYLALGQGGWQGAPMQTVDAAIGRDPRNRLRMAVVDLQHSPGKTARTDITCLSTTTAHCLVHCKLHTGRTHQIRVHMQHLHHPLVADAVYGGAAEGGLQRQALHAFALQFVHPITGQDLALRAPPPDDFLTAAEKLGLQYNCPP